MKVKEIRSIIEDFAPLNLQASYDNSGLVVGSDETEVSGVLLAVDVSQTVIEEAIALGYNMIITHHPIIFSPLKRFNSSNYVERAVEMAIRHSVVLYAAHTNLDSVVDGMSWRLGAQLGLRDMTILDPTSEGAGFGVIGSLLHAQRADDYICHVAEVLGCKMVRHSAIARDLVQRVAICTGSGGSLIEQVRRSDADIYITADLRYNDFMAPGENFTIVDVGHYESEYCANDILFDVLSKKMINFAVRRSEVSCNPVLYRICSDKN